MWSEKVSTELLHTCRTIYTLCLNFYFPNAQTLCENMQNTNEIAENVNFPLNLRQIF